VYGGGGLRGLGSCTSRSIGVRVNPQLGEGGIAATGTVAPTSKFGVALAEVRARARARARVRVRVRARVRVRG
jgi:diaminopimelate decarboxylase